MARYRGEVLIFVPLAAAAESTDLVAGIQASELRATVEALTGEREVDGGLIRSRNLYHPDMALAVDWLVAELQASPEVDVWTETVEASGSTPEFPNIVAELPGSSDTDVLVLAAHYDSMAGADGDWLNPRVDPAPGADDDASGCAAVLAVARALAAYEPGFRTTIRFVLFGGEEYGLLGSEAYALDNADSTVAMLQLDPIGYNAGDAWTLFFVHDDASVALAEGLATLSAEGDTQLTTYAIDEKLIGGDERSDHAPFWAAGVPALYVGSFPQPPSYHTMDDTIDNVDPEFMAQAAKLLGAYLAQLAEPNQPVVESVEDPYLAADCGCGGTAGGGLLGVATAAIVVGRRIRRARWCDESP